MKKQLFVMALLAVLAVCFMGAPAAADMVVAKDVSVKTVRKRQEPKGDSNVFTVRYDAVYSTKFKGKDGAEHALTVRAVSQKVGEKVRDRAWGDYIMRTVDTDLVLNVILDGKLMYSGEAENDQWLHADLVLPTGDVLDVRVDASRAASSMVFNVQILSEIPDLLENAM